jgi:PHP family Zn ribbon phosphoesterase
MDPVKFNCQCQNASSRWSEMAPTEMHSYRVECDRCGKFIKWGAKDELEHRVRVRDKITVVPWIDPPSATLEKFFSE